MNIACHGCQEETMSSSDTWTGREATSSRDEDIMNKLASFVGLGNKHKMSLSGTTFMEVNLISYWFTGTSLLSHVNHAALKEFFP